MSVTVSAATKPPPFAKGLPLTVSISPSTTVLDVKKSIAAKYPKFYVERQKLSLKDDRKALADETKLSEAGVKDGGELSVKDLGPQLGWTTVFLIEYVGPLIVHPIIYHFPKVFYGKDVVHSELQKYIYAMVLAHFFKRELETLFVHRFSHGTMPFRNIFKNSFHYHVISGLALALDIYRPKYAANSTYVAGTFRSNPTYLNAAAAVWLYSELSNLSAHITLRNLRPAGSKKRAIPYGYGFSAPFSISCPNYFFEIVGWSVIAGITNSYAGWAFVALSFYQMGVWAVKKHRNYRKEFGKEYPRRTAMVPYIF